MFASNGPTARGGIGSRATATGRVTPSMRAAAAGAAATRRKLNTGTANNRGGGRNEKEPALKKKVTKKKATTTSKNIDPPPANPALMTARDRERYYSSQHVEHRERIDDIDAYVQSRIEEMRLIVDEQNAEFINSAELEELNADSFANLKCEIKNVYEELASEVIGLRSSQSRSIDALNNTIMAYKRSIDEEKVTMDNTAKHRVTIESNVTKSIFATLESKLNREMDNMSLQNRATALDSARHATSLDKTIAALERKVHEQSQNIFNLEKDNAKFNILWPSDDAINAAVGGTPGHQLGTMNFTIQGLTTRMLALENKGNEEDRAREQFSREFLRKMEDVAANLTNQMESKQEENAEKSNLLIANTREELDKIITHFKGAFMTEADRLFKRTTDLSEAARIRVDENEKATNEKLFAFEGKLGRAAIDFNRLHGDTNHACEALASGLHDVRKVSARVDAWSKGADASIYDLLAAYNR
jgi:hypothetical protein